MRGWIIAITLPGTPLMATDAPPALTLERVFASPDLNGSQPQALQLSPDGTLLASLRPRADERTRLDLWVLDTVTGTERMLVDSRTLGAGGALSEAEKMQRERDRSLTGKTGIVRYDWSPDGKAILFPLDGDLYVTDLAGNAVRATNSAQRELNPTISPAGGFVGYVRDQNLYVQGLRGCATARTEQLAVEFCETPRALTTDGGGTVHWGEAEFVADEEMDRRTGYWWSPDDRHIAVARFDEAPVGIVRRAAIGAEGTTIVDQRYPAAGTPNVLIELHVLTPDGAGRVKVDLGAEADSYLARVDWAPDGKALYVQRQNRAQTRLDLLRVDPATGRSEVVFTERAAKGSWINLSDAFRALGDGSLIWWSERDGHGHLYRWRAGKWTQLTRGEWEVAGLVAVDEATGRLTFAGNRDGMLERHVYAIDYRKPGAPVRLTEPGWWNTASGTGGRMIVTRSSPTQPPQTYLADAAGTRLRWISENAVAGAHPYAPFAASHRARTFGTLTAADGSVLQYEMITPPLEPGRRYPVFFQHYGGPHVQTVSRAWGGALQQYLVSRGWIWFQLDNRGSANRGVAFERQIHRAMGGVEVADQLAGAAWLKAQGFVDPGRIATYGWSYGGYLTLKLLEAAPGVFAAGVAGAPVTRWGLYDTHYTERYLGDPGRDAAAYARADALGDAARIADPLLLLHGMADDNVVLDNTTAFAARLQAANRPFEMMLYPGKTHGAARDVHVWTTIERFLDRTVRDAPPK